MKDNFYDKYSDVFVGMNEDDSAYILRCLKEPKGEIKQLSEMLRSFYEDILCASDMLEKANKSFLKKCEKTCALVKKYNDTLATDGIWNSVAPAEVKKKLNTFYAFVAAVEKLDDVDLPDIGIDELIEADVEKGKNLSLLKRAAFIFEVDNEREAEALISKYRLCHSMLKDIIEKNTDLFKKTRHNEAVLGKYISSLALSLDEKNKGEKMNLSLARNCAEVFLSNYITDK